MDESSSYCETVKHGSRASNQINININITDAEIKI